VVRRRVRSELIVMVVFETQPLSDTAIGLIDDHITRTRDSATCTGKWRRTRAGQGRTQVLLVPHPPKPYPVTHRIVNRVAVTDCTPPW